MGRHQPCDCALVFPDAKMGHDGAGTAAHALAQWEEEEADGRVPLVGEKEREKGGAWVWKERGGTWAAAVGHKRERGD